MTQGRSKRRAAGRFERYSDDMRREFEKLLVPDDLELLERLGQQYTMGIDLKNWFGTPTARAKVLDKDLGMLASLRKHFVESGRLISGGVGLPRGTTVEDFRAEVRRLKNPRNPKSKASVRKVSSTASPTG